MVPTPNPPHPSAPRRATGIPVPLDRRSFLVRTGRIGGAGFLALGAPALLAACGGSGETDDADRLSLMATGSQLVGLFNYQGGYLVSGLPQRAVFTIASAAGPPTTEGPPVLPVRLTSPGGAARDVTLERHAEGTPIGYYPLFTTFDETGIWTLTAEIEGQESKQSFQVDPARDVKIVQPGQAMIPVATPTGADARGVTPVCTRDPQCPLHERDLASVLASGQAVALMISTPQYCQTAVCGPVLDMVTTEAARRPNMAFVHAEVYVNPSATPDPGAGGTTPAVDRYGLTFEPSLFVARADGTVTSRLDNVFDTRELAQALDAATA